jgi:hypothetical protein
LYAAGLLVVIAAAIVAARLRWAIAASVIAGGVLLLVEIPF